MVKSEIPPPLLVINHAWQHRISYFQRHRYWHYTHCHSSPPRNYKKAKKEKRITMSHPHNLWTDNTDISKSAFLSRRQGQYFPPVQSLLVLSPGPVERFNIIALLLLIFLSLCSRDFQTLERKFPQRGANPSTYFLTLFISSHAFHN